MNLHRVFHVVVLVGTSERSLDAAFAAYRAAAPEDIDEVHVAGPPRLVDRLRPCWPTARGVRWSVNSARAAPSSAAPLSTASGTGPSSDASQLANDALRLLSTLCQRGRRITIVVAVDAGVIGFALQTALQLAGGVDAVAARAASIAATDPLTALYLTDMALAADAAHRGVLDARIRALQVLIKSSTNSNERGWLAAGLGEAERRLK